MALSQQLERALARKRELLRQRDAAVSDAVELRRVAAATVLESRDAVRRARSLLHDLQHARVPQTET